MTWSPQKAVNIAPVQVSSTEMIVSTETRYLPIFTCPDNVGFKIEVLSVGVICSIAPIISSGTVTLDVEVIDDSDSQSRSEIGGADASATAYDLEGITVDAGTQLWRGSQVLDPGDSIDIEAVTGTTVSTAAVGLMFYVEYRILERS